MMTFYCVLTCGLLLVVPTSWCGWQDRVKRSLPDLQQAPFSDLLAEVRPFTNESSGSLMRHVMTAMGVFKDTRLSPPSVRRQTLLSGITPACLACRVLAKMVLQYIRSVPDPQPGFDSLVSICKLVVYSQDQLCEVLISTERPVLEYVIRHSSASPEQLCQLIFSSKSVPPNLHCGLHFQGDKWAVHIPPPSSRWTQKQLSTNEAPVRVPSVSGGGGGGRKDFNGGRPYLKMLHLTDLHYDPNYLEGSNAECDAPLCCQTDSGKPRHPAAGAGRWGDYRACDSPERLLRHLFQHLRTQHPDIDYIAYTGDSVAHDAWELSRKKNTFIINKVSEFFSEYFPNTPIFGALGNHESFPRDSFPPPEDPRIDPMFSNSWLYKLTADRWQRHLPNVKISKEASVSGCYSALLEPGLRIISINTNFCYKFNWWVLYKNTDPGNVLRWLVQELLEAEQRGERVQIVGHIAPLYGDCYEQWAHQFSRIVTRFSETIRGQFYGHSHLMEVLINYDVNHPNRPVGVQYLTPSNTPYYRLNPAFTLFYIDGDHPKSTRAVLDTETFYMNLTAANSHDDVRWLPLYRARADLGLDSLEPEGWEALVRRMDRSVELTKQFHRYQVTESDELRDDCDLECRKTIICSMVDGDKFLPRKC